MKYKSEILEMIHENAISNFKIGAISETRMREYDEICLAEEKPETAKKPEPVTPRHNFNHIPVSIKAN